ncbi:MAG: kelch repeat-containing protein [Planctomycetota bacterium]
MSSFTWRTASTAAGAILLLAPTSVAQQWFERVSTSSPGARSDFAMTYDSTASRSVLFSGKGPGGGTASDTWTWNGTSWTDQMPASAPPPRLRSAMAHDPTTGLSVLFAGGGLADTWRYDATNNVWSFVAVSTAPSPREKHAMAFHSSVGTAGVPGIVLFGGEDGTGEDDETWVFADAWTQLMPYTVPPERSNHAMAYDAARGVIVMFGGFDRDPYGYSIRYQDTWEFDGNDWSPKSSYSVPPARESHQLVYDPDAGVCVLTGGHDGIMNFGDVWHWDGSDWAAVTPAPAPTGAQPASPPTRRDHGMVYHAATQEVMVYGGAEVGNPVLDGAWVRTSATVPFPSGSRFYKFGPGSGPATSPTCTALYAESVEPQLRTDDVAANGASFQLDFVQLPQRSALVALHLDSSATGNGLPCQFHLPASSPSIPLSYPGTGPLSWTVNLPTDPGLVGVDWYFQGILLEPFLPKLSLTSSIHGKVY